ncbi:transcription factor [Grosmannia clavigera kw1407]|uniref:Transcription factor n=1 Tax=Grosmannia clavigera (strain kw1407 / UAMH 11150) TaxID=655863 RepID=F0X834_GROCL|nr:transcription factor [Grosmannia clavigera kw1407]EFX05442.1 transcription factor [Grosmannia clavigera kw1407]
MDSSPRNKTAENALPSVAGVKRSAPTLLPPFEPLSSSPGLPRLVKKARGGSAAPSFNNARTKYPTPVPTSSTGILSSSPPQRGGPRPVLQRTASTSERAPLGVVPTAELNENGETMLMGRSSNSSHYQLSANRLISRVHVKARYVPAVETLEPNRVEIVCCGWNGLKLHCQGRTWELGKGDTFTSETENTEIMLDVQDARVRIQWPKKDRNELLGGISDSSWDDSPRSKIVARRVPGTPGAPGASPLQSSPLRGARIASPVSPTPAGIPASGASLQALLAQQLGSDGEDEDDTGPAIQIYEDGSADELELPVKGPSPGDASFATDVMDSFSSELSELPSDDEDNNQHDQNNDDDLDEENDPIIHSFGPFGANLSSRFASVTARSPQIERPRLSRILSEDDLTMTASSREADAGKKGIRRHPTTGRSLSPHAQKQERDLATEDLDDVDTDKALLTDGVGLGISVATENASSLASPVISSNVDIDTVRNHLINQLAFSRLSSSPLSTIMSNLPAEERRDLTRDGLRYIIDGTNCVGVILRQGKDAAGQALESEYYYIADFDEDLSRKAVIDGLRKPSLRNCRKQHKQYYWKRPRTP